jgi:hypothetical protein
VSFEKLAQTLPDYTPQWNARLGAQQLYDAYQKSGLRVEDFEGQKYKRIAHIQSLLRDGQLAADLRWNACVPQASRA